MKTNRYRIAVGFSLAWAVICWQAPAATGQMIHTGVGLGNSNWGYSEGYSLGWSIRRGGISIQRPAGVLFPPFGPQIQPSSFAVGGPLSINGWRGSFGLFGGQSSVSTFSGTSASVTTMDGYPGSIQSQTLQPFVFGFTPIVGGWPAVSAEPTFLPQSDPAQQQQRSEVLQRVRQSQQTTQDKRLEKYLRRARDAEATGNARMARANYKYALRVAPPPTQSVIQEALRTLGRRMRDRQR
ncbi:MAG: hypothetical protein AAF958_12200 [Planctomycetota bacterium]